MFICNPRTGCTATAALLANQYGGKSIPPSNILDDQGKFIVVQRKHSTIRQLLEGGLVTPELLEGITKFTTVRNPFDSIASIWVKKKFQYAKLAEEDPDFFGYKISNFMDDMKFIKDHDSESWVIKSYEKKFKEGKTSTVNFPHAAGCDELLRFETLQESFAKLMAKLGLPVHRIERINVTELKHPEYRKYYTSRARDIIGGVFKPDLETYGYSF